LLDESLFHRRAAHDAAGEAGALYNIGGLYTQLGDQKKALEATSQALQVARAAHDAFTEAWALDLQGAIYENFGDRKKAVGYYDQALPLHRAAGDRQGEGNALNNLGMAFARLGEKRKALDYFKQSQVIFRELQDRRNLATLAANIGATQGDLGDHQLELDSYLEALAVQRQLGNRIGEAITLNNLGTTYLSLGEYQKALDSLRAAMAINRDHKLNTSINLNNVGRVYAALGDSGRALDFFTRAIQLQRELNFQWGLAHTLNYAGEIRVERGENRKALALHNEALAMARAVHDPDMEAFALTDLAQCYVNLGERDRAREHFERALAIHRNAQNQRLLADTLRNLGGLERQKRDLSRAAEYLDEALAIDRAIRDRNGEANTLAELVRLDRDRGDLLKARQRADEAWSAFESLRLGVISPKLRATLLASARRLQELDLEILAQLHRQHPTHRYDGAALEASEKGRARSLLEMLGESRTEIRQGVDGELINRESQLQHRIAAKAEQQVRLLSGQHSDAESAAAAKELDALGTELEQVQSKIRETSPQYAALTQPVPLSLEEIQTQLLDADTVLLEYSLASEKSFLWAVTASSIELFELPRRAEIESAAKKVYELVTARDARAGFQAAASKASSMLLGPVAARLENKRILIVADGVLQYLPFAALPDPSGRPLIVNHEVVMAPSASVVAVLRQETAGRRPARKQLAVLADPVYSIDDPRIAAGNSLFRLASRSAPAPGQDFVRLRFSRREADEIARFAPAQGTFKAVDFDASRATVLSRDFGQHRIIHFATHSLLNNERPELSGIVLSLVDRHGRPQNGFLRLYDIYNLRLSSDLVVLSACQTALGGEIKGEGLIGLTRAFLYAGAPRVVATLWETDDRASAELMKRFYEALLVRHERPAAALRSAQVALWRTNGWDAPYYWAAFTLQGEWR
jgi:CHAT domain-containing protein/Tfp pilus assembly protein PilF